MSDDKEEENNEEYASGYSRGRSGDIVRDSFNEVWEDHESQEYKGYKDGEADRDRYGYKDADDCGTGETKDDGGGCFLTTACIQARGLDDWCEQLQTLRHFRDSVVASIDEGPALINEYYKRAPVIVAAINASPARMAEWQRVCGEIECCVAAIRDGGAADALGMYRRLYARLQRDYVDHGQDAT